MPKKINKDSIKRILFISLSNIGDAVLTTPALGLLRDNFPQAQLDVMAGPGSAGLFNRHPAVSRLLIYDKHDSLANKWRLVKDLRRSRYDIIADMRGTMFAFLAGSRYSAGLIRKKPHTAVHKKLEHISKLSSLGIRPDGYAPFFIHITEDDNVFADGVEASLAKGPLKIAISPGAKSKIKRWPKDKYAELARSLAADTGGQVIFVGDKEDSLLVRHMDLGGIPGMIDLCGRTTLTQLAALLRRCDMLITNDSAGMHLASAVGTKVLAIFGPTDPGLYGPTGKDDIVARKILSCSPCQKAQCAFNHECMELIEVGEVYSAAMRMLYRKEALVR